MLERINELSGLIQTILIITGFVAIYYKDKGKNDVNNVSQEKDIEKLQNDCIKCKEDVDERFSLVNKRISKVEEKQSNDIRELYNKLDQVEQRILQTINSRLDGTLKIITDLFKNQK
ncbi:hypothetical protein SDC9_17683 [bioreactor metagenome]|jgi:hypothetical protein|uniref:Uncharacterized protein n=1 Tax=bioreactor metagenome TaxID=1076179 RepID=A0A644TY95_9ZZZZ|nr:hypothetical protein [Lentimicrobium sp.]MEA5111679.1 hypothetical protein [Lentimicrobium sp.]